MFEFHNEFDDELQALDAIDTFFYNPIKKISDSNNKFKIAKYTDEYSFDMSIYTIPPKNLNSLLGLMEKKRSCFDIIISHIKTENGWKFYIHKANINTNYLVYFTPLKTISLIDTFFDTTNTIIQETESNFKATINRLKGKSFAMREHAIKIIWERKIYTDGLKELEKALQAEWVAYS